MQNSIVILREILWTSDGIEIPQLSKAEQIFFFLGNYHVIYVYARNLMFKEFLNCK